jgi:hypothetical protein
MIYQKLKFLQLRFRVEGSFTCIKEVILDKKILQIKQLKLSICSDTTLIALGFWYLKGKRVQDCKKPKVEMYKLIWGLVFKRNGNGI